jgi:hypothetical protein
MESTQLFVVQGKLEENCGGNLEDSTCGFGVEITCSFGNLAIFGQAFLLARTSEFRSTRKEKEANILQKSTTIDNSSNHGPSIGE